MHRGIATFTLGTVLAFDWNASGLTTNLTAAFKEAIRHEEKNLGLFICGGKDATPCPVDLATYDLTIATLAEAVRRSRIHPLDKDKAIQRLSESAREP